MQRLTRHAARAGQLFCKLLCGCCVETARFRASSEAISEMTAIEITENIHRSYFLADIDIEEFLDLLARQVFMVSLPHTFYVEPRRDYWYFT